KGPSRAASRRLSLKISNLRPRAGNQERAIDGETGIAAKRVSATTGSPSPSPKPIGWKETLSAPQFGPSFSRSRQAVSEESSSQSLDLRSNGNPPEAKMRT